MDVFSNTSDQILSGYRYEVKIPMERAQLAEFRHYLRQLGLHPVSPYPPRKVSSVYYDTHELDDYIDNVSGIANRSKTRIRWYNDDISQLTLEFKNKRNKVSNKETFVLKNTNLNDPRTRVGTRAIIAGAKNRTDNLIVKVTQPVIEVQYDREYFLLLSNLRMTIDVNQRFRKLYPTPSQSLINSPVHCVAEFKFPANKRVAMQSMIRNLPFRVFRHSKYVIGMDTVAL